MLFKKRLIAAFCTILVGSAPSLCHAQTLNDFFKLMPKGTSAGDIIGAIRSISEVTQGQVPAGAAPENVDGKVVLYRTASCGYCKLAAAHMQRKNIAFVERDIQTNPDYKAEFKRLGGKGVPLMVFREKTMSGFNETAFDRYYSDLKRTEEDSSNPGAVASTARNTSSDSKVIQSGDVLVGKIGGVTIYNEPSKSSKLAVLGKSDEVIYMGEERAGYYRVTTQNGEGWIDKLLVKKQ